MATVRAATGSLLDVVNQTSTAIVSTVNVISGGMEMLNDYVTRQRVKQQDVTIADLLSHRKIVLENHALEATKREENIRTYIGNDEAKQAKYNSAYAELEEAFKAAEEKRLAA